MTKLPMLNFPKYHFRMREDISGPAIYSEVRRQWLVLTPEEWVRRHLARWLIFDLEVPLVQMIEEYPLRLNGMHQRADLVVVSPQGRVVLMAECKARDVTLDMEVIGQAIRYNSVLGARYVFITNGVKHLLYECDAEGNTRPATELPRNFHLGEE